MTHYVNIIGIVKILWADGLFVCSIGEASAKTIGEYILNQELPACLHLPKPISASIGFLLPLIKKLSIAKNSLLALSRLFFLGPYFKGKRKKIIKEKLFL